VGAAASETGMPTDARFDLAGQVAAVTADNTGIGKAIRRRKRVPQCLSSRNERRNAVTVRQLQALGRAGRVCAQRDPGALKPGMAIPKNTYRLRISAPMMPFARPRCEAASLALATRLVSMMASIEGSRRA